MIKIFFIGLLSFFVSSIYNYQFQDTDGNTVSMSAYQNKKILLVNIATNSNKAGQLTSLRQLQQQFADSLVVIAFPSNSFGNELRSNAEIKQFCQANYNTNFIIASKSSVAGINLNAIYNWLANKTENGDMDLEIGGDFEKVLIGKDGTIQGIFSPKLDPLCPQIINAIQTNY